MKSEAIKVLLIDGNEDDYILTRELLCEMKAGKGCTRIPESMQISLDIVRLPGLTLKPLASNTP